MNMERWRWLPDDLGSRYMLVNIPAFRLDAIEDGKSVLDMKVVTGKKDSPTPVLADRMTTVVFSPYWNIPHGHRRRRRSCRRSDKDPGYLERNNIEVDEEGGRYRQRPGQGQLARAGEVRVPEPLQRLPARHAGAGAVRAGRARLQPRLRAARASRWISRSTCCAISRSGPTRRSRAAMNAGDGTRGRAEAAAADLPRVLHRMGGERRAEDRADVYGIDRRHDGGRPEPNDAPAASLVVVRVCRRLPRPRRAPPTKFDTKTASFAVTFHGETSAYRDTSVVVMPRRRGRSSTRSAARPATTRVDDRATARSCSRARGNGAGPRRSGRAPTS